MIEMYSNGNHSHCSMCKYWKPLRYEGSFIRGECLNFSKNSGERYPMENDNVCRVSEYKDDQVSLFEGDFM